MGRILFGRSACTPRDVHACAAIASMGTHLRTRRESTRGQNQESYCARVLFGSK